MITTLCTDCVLLTEDGYEVGDAQQGDDDQQRLGRLPVLVVRRLATPSGPQLQHHHVKYRNQEESVRTEKQQHRTLHE